MQLTEPVMIIKLEEPYKEKKLNEFSCFIKRATNTLCTRKKGSEVCFNKEQVKGVLESCKGKAVVRVIEKEDYYLLKTVCIIKKENITKGKKRRNGKDLRQEKVRATKH